ncbi:putative ferric-chelate reductase 1 isoform X1 [Ostrea edulis]|uniref:putative ferric-chelate reductase 1 isoform X1 n=1 Tax=Ostrea edulis TaxID=37623 RepID=UPI0020949147|nr:putative ferric-chelate reductase 1 isoform X1 [Ostrea edulis]
MEFVLLITAFNLFGAVRGFSYGAPDAFCQYQNLQDRNVKLVPGHTGVEPMNSRVPNRYQIVVGPENRNGQRRVTLKADPGDYFRGFFIQATRANYALDRGDRPAYGTFRPADTNSQSRRCRSAVGKVGGITHTGNNNKTEISFDWEPPRGCNLGDIQFVATVVRAYSEYWVDVRSDVIAPSGFVGDRGLLCQLYVNPYSKILQRRVLSALRNIQNLQQRGGRGANRLQAQG